MFQIIHKKSIEQFYKDLQEQFPKMKELKTWNTWDWSNNSSEHSVIMAEVAKEMIEWTKRGDTKQVQKLLDFIELSFENGDRNVTSYLCTDFLTTIMEVDEKPIREAIKQMMKPETEKCYKQLLSGYTEPD